jgi:hypothetical protein
VVRALVAGLAAAAATFVVAAIVLTVVDIYLAGHGLPRPMQRRLSAQTNVADVIVVSLSAVVGVVVVVRHLRRH